MSGSFPAAKLDMMDLSGKRILIVKPSSLGDVVHTLPLAHAIKRCYPSCHLSWIVQETFAGILENDPAIDEIIPVLIPSTSDPQAPWSNVLRAFTATIGILGRLRRRFRSNPYDIVLDLHASFRSGLMLLVNRGGLKIGFADAKELNTLFQTYRIACDPEKPHAVDKNLAFAQFLACPSEPADFRICSGASERDNVARFLEAAGIDTDDRIVYANPTARWETKLWTIPSWAELADLLIRRAGARVIFAGSPGDLPYILRITKLMKEEPVVAAGKLNLAEAVALMEVVDLYVGVDSGPMHVAAFSGTPVVALFGPTDPAKVGPYGDGHLVIRQEDLDCLACRKRSCSDRSCLEGLKPLTVFERAFSMISPSRKCRRIPYPDEDHSVATLGK